MAMCQKIISNAEADREYTLFKGSFSCSKWICQSVRKKFSCISCNVYNFPLMTRGNQAPPEIHIKMGVRDEGSNCFCQAGQTQASLEEEQHASSGILQLLSAAQL